MAEYGNVETNKPYVEEVTVVDMNIVEYLYTCPLNDIIADDDLMKLIVSNGIYKRILCESNNIKSIDIIIDSETYTLYGPNEDAHRMLDVLEGRINMVLGGVEIIDSSQ